MSHSKIADPDHPVLPQIAERWSPYILQPRPVEPEKLKSCLEAARWAASSYNEQPWAFIVAERTNTAEFETMLGCLMEANQAWAKQAGVLIITCISTRFSRNQNPNRVAMHDLGMATANFSLQAVELGLVTHHMAGVNLSVCRQTYEIPEAWEPVTAIAVGYAGTEEDALDPSFVDRDSGSRSRKPQSEFVFHGKFGS